MLYEVSLVIDSNDEFNIVFYDPYVDDLEFMLLDSSSQVYGYSISPDLPNWFKHTPNNRYDFGNAKGVVDQYNVHDYGTQLWWY